MRLGFGRVVSAAEADERTTEARVAPALRPVASRVPRGRVAPAEIVNAADTARALVERAERSAADIVQRAEREAADLRLRALTEARAEAAARIAAHALALSFREDQALERNLDRVVEVARILAERLLGEALGLEPARVVALARRAVEEARGARRITVIAHPADAVLIEQALHSLNAGGAASVLADPARSRGSLRLDTDLGVLDADLAPQLDRLLPKLRESLGHG
jgi:flagellar biosynthesis/type III secretory pathway protein FliH